MKLRRYTAVFICLILIMSLLCACSAPSEPEPAPSAVPTATQEPAPTPSPEVKEFRISECRPIVENGKYVCNPYLLTEECTDCYGEGFAEFYKGFVAAFMNYETSCPCPDEEYAKAVNTVAGYECPFFSPDDINCNWATDYDYDACVLSWSYNISDKELKERIETITAEIQGLLDLVSASDAEDDKIQTLYHAFCPLMSYDNDAAVSRQAIDAFNAFTEHRGICVTFATAFCELVSQAGLTATQASGNTASGGSPAWNYIRVTGNWYFFDPTFELSSFEGGAFTYYGMTMAEREESGIQEENMWIGVYTTIEPQTPEKGLFVK